MIFLCVLAIITVNPSGDFPLNDDWSYGKAVKHLVEDGVYSPTGWSTSSLFSQALWGAMFCIPFGFSFTALRFSTLSLSLLCVLATYLILKQLKLPRYISLIAALIVAANPIYFALSNSFMPDVPFTAFSVLAILFLLKSIQSESDWSLIAGIFMVCISVLCRQTGLFIPLAFAPVYLIRNRLSPRTIIRAGLPLIAGIGSLLIFEKWLSATVGLPALYGSKEYVDILKTIINPEVMIWKFFWTTFTATVYLGLFLSPFLLLFPNPFNLIGKKAAPYSIVIFTGFILSSALAMYAEGRYMPLAGNTLTKSGIGPVTLHDVFVQGLPHMTDIAPAFWIFITAIGVISGGFLLVYIFCILKNLFDNRSDFAKSIDKTAALFMLLLCVVYFSAITIVRAGAFSLDRYLLPLIPLLCILLAVSFKPHLSRRQPFLLSLASLLIILFFMFSVAATRDYLTWNRTRWHALQILTEKKNIPPSMIDGGFEFNGWQMYDPEYSHVAGKSWWWVQDDTYLITMGPVRRYEILSQYRFRRWLPPQEASIFVLRRRKGL